MSDARDVLRDHLQIDSDMIDPDQSEDGEEGVPDEYMIEDVDSNYNDQGTESSHDGSVGYDDEEQERDSEEDSLQRLSSLSRRRQENQNEFAFDDSEEISPEDFLRRLINARSRHTGDAEDSQRGESDEENEEEDANEDGESRPDFLRAMGSISYGNSRVGGGRNAGFAEVVQRLMGGGIVLGGRDHSEMDNLIQNLNQREDSYIILETLNELSERLLMMNGITAERVIPANSLASSIVHIMEDQSLSEELELQLVACRCLYNFLEVNQDFVHDALNNNAVEVLCAKLMEISFIDLTEQALQTLEMISRDSIAHNAIVANNGLKACLQYLDFLTIHAQRRCFTIVANSCTNIKMSNFDMVKDIFDIISNVVVNYSDSTVIENGWLAISRVISSFRQYPKLLEDLFLTRGALLQELCQVIVISCNKSSSSDETRTPVKYGTCLNLIKSLIVLISVSVKISRLLLDKCEIGKIITRSLNKFSKNKGEISSQTLELGRNMDEVGIEALMSVPKELTNQFLILIGYLLPITYDSKKSAFLMRDYQEPSERREINEARIRLYTDDISSIFEEFTNEVWILLINTFQATMDYQIRKRAIICLYRICCFGNEETIQSIRNIELVSGLLASIVGQNRVFFLKDTKKRGDLFESESDSPVKVDDNKRGLEDQHKTNSLKLLLGSFLIAEELLAKLHDTFIDYFTREGIVDDIIMIADDMDGTEISHSPLSHPHPLFPSVTFIDAELIRDLDLKLSREKLDKSLPLLSRNLADVLTKSINEREVPSHLKALSQIKDKLNDLSTIREFNYENWRQMWIELKNSLIGADGRDVVSSFELISSGIIKTLSHLFTSEGEDFGFEFSDCYKTFLSVFFVEEARQRSILILVGKLQESLNRSESFEIVSSGGTPIQPSIFQPVSDQTTLMARQVKLRLVSADDSIDGGGSQLKNLILSVHAIATLRSVDTFLRQRMQVLDDVNAFSSNERDDTEGNKLEDVSVSSKNEVQDDSGCFEFLMNGEAIPVETTIFGAVYRALQVRDSKVDCSQIWSRIHDVSFRRIERPEEIERKITNQSSFFGDNELELEYTNVLEILKLLKTIFEMNTFVKKTLLTDTSLEDDKFMNWKLTVKLNRQLDEPLVVASGILPEWSVFITRKYPFIFPLETRLFFLQSTSFGYSRLIQQWQIRTNQENDNENNRLGNTKPVLGRPTRIKVKLSRQSIFQSAMKVLNLYGHTPGILEIEYFDEVGSGLGPTLEFYSTVSREFSKRRIRLWRDNSGEEDDDSYVNNNSGLFPGPLDKSQILSENGKKVIYFFNALGKFVARALIDSRIIDFNFNVVFLKLVQLLNSNHIQKSTGKGMKKIANISCLRLIDPTLASSMEHLLKYVKQFSNYEESRRDEIIVDGATLKDLTLTFTIPGYPDYALVNGGDLISINSSNIESYINKVLDATLYSGVLHQTKAFMEGFSKVFPIESLIVFSADELVDLFGSAEEDWSSETLSSAINANHGYSKDSNAIKWLIEILVDFNKIEKRSFLQFLTGAPKLPVGGFRSLRPELTVVKKVPEDGSSDDDFLPSVMTCANYLKLPNYSSKSIMKSRILQAINEGAGAFLLS